jgi:Tfp pilus assembly protein PilF
MPGQPFQEHPFMPYRSLRVASVLVCAVVLSSCSKDKQEYFRAGTEYLDGKRYAAAIVEFKNALKVDPQFGLARYRLGEAYELNGQLNAALKEYVRAADLLSDDKSVQL